jgi:hypothetical protein
VVRLSVRTVEAMPAGACEFRFGCPTVSGRPVERIVIAEPLMDREHDARSVSDRPPLALAS